MILSERMAYNYSKAVIINEATDDLLKLNPLNLNDGLHS